MDIVAHGLWVGIGLAAAGRRWRVTRRTAAATLGLAVAPDLAQLLPLIAGIAFEPGGVAVLTAYVSALPGSEPHLSPLVALLTHHLHCIMHSAVVAGAVTGVVCFVSRSFWLPLLGWWSHIVIDVFTHSADFYAVPVLYPFTARLRRPGVEHALVPRAELRGHRSCGWLAGGHPATQPAFFRSFGSVTCPPIAWARAQPAT